MQSGVGQECPATQPGHDGTSASEKVTLILHLLCCKVPGTNSALPHLGSPGPPRASRENTLSTKHSIFCGETSCDIGVTSNL